MKAPVFSIFPKFFRHLSLEELAGLLEETGLDTTNMPVRDGFWVTPAGLKKEAPEFVKTMAGFGRRVTFATTGFSADALLADSTPLAILADAGVRQFRMGYFRNRSGDPHRAFAAARKEMEELARVCEKIGIQAVYQVHHGTLVTHSLSAYRLVEGLPPEFIGVELDPGNQTHEGWENWDMAAGLLGPYFCAAGIKDSRPERDREKADTPAKGWRREWCSLCEGVVNWHDFVGALERHGFSGPLVFMPFYHETDTRMMRRVLGEEVAFLRRLIAGTEPA